MERTLANGVAPMSAILGVADRRDLPSSRAVFTVRRNQYRRSVVLGRTSPGADQNPNAPTSITRTGARGLLL